MFLIISQDPWKELASVDYLKYFCNFTTHWCTSRDYERSFIWPPQFLFEKREILKTSLLVSAAEDMWIQEYVCGRTIGNLGWGYVDKYVCGRTIVLYSMRICG